jgi:VanZ family protein
MKRATNDPPISFATTPAPLLMRLARMAGFAGIAAITILSLVPGHMRPHTGFPGQAEHFAAYACTGFALSLAHLRLRERLMFWSGLATASGVFEILQIWIPGRGAKIQDALASTLGLTAGLVLGAMAAAWLFSASPVENPKKQREHHAG